MAGLRQAKAILENISPPVVTAGELPEDGFGERDQIQVQAIRRQLTNFEAEFEELGKILEDLRGHGQSWSLIDVERSTANFHSSESNSIYNKLD
jgi:hypothetical protein